jgi:hypothetical protein
LFDEILRKYRARSSKFCRGIDELFLYCTYNVLQRIVLFIFTSAIISNAARLGLLNTAGGIECLNLPNRKGHIALYGD